MLAEEGCTPFNLFSIFLTPFVFPLGLILQGIWDTVRSRIYPLAAEVHANSCAVAPSVGKIT